MSTKNKHNENKFSFFLVYILLICVGLFASYNTLSKTDCFKSSTTLSGEIPNNNNENDSEKEVFDDNEDDFFTRTPDKVNIHFIKINDLNKEEISLIPFISFDIQIPPPKNKLA